MLCAQTQPTPTHLHSAWISATDAAADAERTSLEADLAASRSALTKDAIRAGTTALGEWHASRGDAAAALRCHVRARDYCSTPAHVAESALAAARAAAAARDAAHAGAYAAKAAASPPGALAGAPAAAAAAGVAVASFDAAKWRQAALDFAAVGEELGVGPDARPDDGWLASTLDVALCGGLAAAASLDRSELKSVVLARPAFRGHLAAAPRIAAGLRALASARFGDGLTHLRAALPLAKLHPRTASVADALYGAARGRALAQYVAPYSRLSVAAAAATLGGAAGAPGGPPDAAAAAPTDPATALADELAALIDGGSIGGRLDAAAGVLVRPRRDPPAVAAADALEAAANAGAQFVADAHALLLRASLVAAGVVARAPPSAAGGDRGPRRGDRAEAFAFGADWARRAGAFGERGGGFGDDDMLREGPVAPGSGRRRG